jgi:hypothetical protein
MFLSSGDDADAVDALTRSAQKKCCARVELELELSWD